MVKFFLSLSVLALVVIVTSSYAYSASSTQQKQNKVSVCHNDQVLEVAQAAVQSHFEHGDVLGDCQPIVVEPDPCSVHTTLEQCEANLNSCEPQFGPSYCGVDFCTADYVFQSCGSVVSNPI